MGQNNISGTPTTHTIHQRNGKKEEEAPNTRITSGIQVLDRALYILTAVAQKPHSLADLCHTTGLPRATTHRIAVALEKHRMVSREDNGYWIAGPALAELAPTADRRLETAAEHVLPALMVQTRESVQLYRLSGSERVCIAAAEPPQGLRNTVPVGSRLTLQAGSAAKILMAYAPESLQKEILPHAIFTQQDLDNVRRLRIADSSGEREPGLASASAPVFNNHGEVIAALSISGPIERMGSAPGSRYRVALHEAAGKLKQLIS